VGIEPWAHPASSRQLTITELRGRLVGEGKLGNQLADAFLTRCAGRTWWTQTIAFTAAHARTPGGNAENRAAPVPSCCIMVTPSNCVQMSVTRPSLRR
jgi:hypothetical protein